MKFKHNICILIFRAMKLRCYASVNYCFHLQIRCLKSICIIIMAFFARIIYSLTGLSLPSKLIHIDIIRVLFKLDELTNFFLFCFKIVKNITKELNIVKHRCQYDLYFFVLKAQQTGVRALVKRK